MIQGNRVLDHIMSYRASRNASGRATPVETDQPAIRVWGDDMDMPHDTTHGSLMQRLVSVEQQFASLKNEGKHLEALHFMEMSVFLRKQIYGDERYVNAGSRCILQFFGPGARMVSQAQCFALFRMSTGNVGRPFHTLQYIIMMMKSKSVQRSNEKDEQNQFGGDQGVSSVHDIVQHCGDELLAKR